MTRDCGRDLSAAQLAGCRVWPFLSYSHHMLSTSLEQPSGDGERGK